MFKFLLKMNDGKFRVEFLEDAKIFLDQLDERARAKIIYNIWKSRSLTDKNLFKKLQDNIWEFRTKFNKSYYRLFAFWDKTEKNDTIVITTHGIIKKTDKIPKGDLERAEQLRANYFNVKNKPR